MKTMVRNVTTAILLVVGMIALSLNAQTLLGKEPKPGEQVAQKIKLPESTNSWRQGDRNLQEALSTNTPLDETKTEEVQFWLFLPKDYDAQSTTKTWPLLLFLHGAGERGDDVNKVLIHGPPKLLRDAKYREKFPFITVSPQCHEGRSWSPKQLTLLLDEIEKKYKVDKKRIYVTGLSMGGFGSWNLAVETPDRFAAVAPICGGFRSQGKKEAAAKLVDLPMWVFHGSKDNVVPVNLSVDMVSLVEVAGGKKIRLTLYPEAGHDSWTETYNNEKLYEWFLNNAKP